MPMRLLAAIAIWPAVATPLFLVFWTLFSFWRRHVILWGATALAILAGYTAAEIAWRDELLAPAIDMSIALRILGGAVIAASFVLATVADRQIGLRVRSFMPYFETDGRIDLVTTGAYGVVRHPIYAGGIWFQLGAFLATGMLAIVPALAVLALGALWFTRQEERRLVALLADPAAYERYRARVPALIPIRRRARGSGAR